MSNSEFIAEYGKPRNYGFNTAVGSSYSMGKNTIRACVHNDQTLMDGQTVKLRLLEPLQAGNVIVPKNSLVSGSAKVQGERLEILVSSLEYAGNIIPVELAVYDSDGQKGLSVPSSLEQEAAKEAVEMLRMVGIPEPEKRVRQYPHEFSGGMRQRVMIAIAFACDPKILICDEPTTALDVTIQGQILDIIKNLQKKNQTSVIMITHDLGVVANIAQKIAVMYSGIIVESGTCEDIFYRPRHPYTWALIRSVPRLDLKNKQELATIPGTPPDLLNPPVGCPFCTRCSYCMPICKEEMPEVTEFGGEHKAACWLHHPMAPKVEMPNLEGGEL